MTTKIRSGAIVRAAIEQTANTPEGFHARLVPEPMQCNAEKIVRDMVAAGTLYKVRQGLALAHFFATPEGAAKYQSRQRRAALAALQAPLAPTFSAKPALASQGRYGSRTPPVEIIHTANTVYTVIPTPAPRHASVALPFGMAAQRGRNLTRED